MTLDETIEALYIYSICGLYKHTSSYSYITSSQTIENSKATLLKNSIYIHINELKALGFIITKHTHETIFEDFYKLYVFLPTPEGKEMHQLYLKKYENNNDINLIVLIFIIIVIIIALILIGGK